MRHRSHLVTAAAVGLAIVAGPAVARASWGASGSGSGTGAARSLAAATSVSATAASPTTSAVDVAFTPGANPAGTTYTVTRDKTAAGAAGTTTVCSGLTASPCHDTGLSAGTTYTYTVKTVLQGWTTDSATASATTVASALSITSVVRDGGNKKVHFDGTGAVASTTITVTVCAVNSFPCAAPVATSVKTSPTAGPWSSAQSNSNLNGSQTYYAQAVQGSTTSAVYTFSTSGL